MLIAFGAEGLYVLTRTLDQIFSNALGKMHPI